MKPHSRTRRGFPAAFTLVEVLVAEAVFLILLFVVIQLVFGVLQTAGAQKKRMDVLDDARQSLDRLSLDWSARVRRSDIVASFSRQAVSGTNAANAQISFLTQVQPYTGARHLAWVAYAINNITQVNQGSQAASTPALERGILGYNWSSTDPSGASNPLMTFPMTNPTVNITPTIEPLADTVFRFDYCFLQNVPAAANATTSAPFTINNTLTLTSTNLVGVVVAVAALDQQSRQLLTQAQLVALGNALPTIPDGQSPQAVWTTAVNNASFNAVAKSAGVPQGIAGSVRIFQRVLYVNE